MLQIFKEPLLHFAVLGIGLFALYQVVTGDAPSVADEIVVDAPRIAALAEQFERSWLRPPTATELDGLVRATCATRCCTAKASRSASIAMIP